jgi:hypothetical protein
VELIEGHVDAVATKGVPWRTQSALTVTLSHFPELETGLELLGSRRNTDLTESLLDALWT